jgi:hypothetical protein
VAVFWAGVPVFADGEDVVGRDGGADRALIPSGSRDIEHLGSAHDEVELELLKAAARQRLATGQGELDLGLDTAAAGGPLPITASRMGCLLDALECAWRALGFDRATGGGEVFRQLVAARIIEPVSKLDSARVLEEAGVPPVPYRTVTRRLRVFAQDSWRQQISAACAAHAGLGPASLVLYDVSTLLCRRRHNKVYVTNLAACPDGTPVTAEFVIGAYHQLFQIEMVFTQLAKRAVRPLGGSREHIADLDLVAGDDHAVDEQFG